MKKLALLILMSLSMINFAHASECTPLNNMDNGGIRYFLNLQPSDNIEDVWCRLQSLKGKFKMNIRFMKTNAYRIFDVEFNGTPEIAKAEFHKIFQSLLPSKSGVQAKDENGQEFTLVEEHTVQAQSPNTLDDRPFGIPKEHPYSKEIFIWEPLLIQLKPVNLAGADFKLTIYMRPAVSRALEIIQGMTEDVIFQAATDRVIPGATRDVETDFSCPTRVPDCKDFLKYETINVHAPWVIEAVFLDSLEQNISTATEIIISNIIQENHRWISISDFEQFKIPVGTTGITADDGITELTAAASGDENKAKGTQKLKIAWKDKMNSKNSYFGRSEKFSEEVRSKLIRYYSVNGKTE